MGFSVNMFLYENPSSGIVKGAEALHLIAGMLSGLREYLGINIQFSKFASSKRTAIPSRIGMLVTYFPSFLISFLFLLCKIDWEHGKAILESFGMSDNVSAALSLLQRQESQGSRLLILSMLFCIHFFKRVIEVLFVHRCSGGMALSAVAHIASGYPFIVLSMLYVLHVSEETQKSPQVNLILPGSIFFVTGILGNAYHHYLLSKLRSKGGKAYAIPQGGLFQWIVCPHYTCEMIEWFGIACTCQTIHAFCVVGMMTLLLLGRSVSTKKWYLQKFEDFPRNRKAFIPCLI
eukprot:TRINITY_DN8259_c0_g1_i1.p1 TRINITY_DN8259_c0_g1~~TRINITY_DN8259_c0_g1_i1.p1  ORF type:complete len:290 (+),score=5.21 TRINITY_DN8259_c0_g1_i1:131-1000(+)